MATKSNIISWTLEYACRFKYHNVISAISKKTSTNIEDLSVPKLYLVTSALHSIISSQDFDNYHQALSYLQYLYDSCKDFIPFRIFSKLSTGIKMMILLKMLEENKEGILSKLNELFPRSGASYEDVDKKELQRLTSVYSNFRKFYLPLSANRFHCNEYFRDEYQDEYGPEFHSALTRLTDKFLSNIECHLPPTTLEKFMKCSDDQCYELHEESPTPTFEIFLDVILGKSKLIEADLMQLLTMLGTISESERVQPLDHIGLYTSSERSSSGRDHDGSKSLFSSSSNSEQNKIISETNVSAGKSHSNLFNEIFDSHRHCTNIIGSNTVSDVYDSHETYRHLGTSNSNVNTSKHVNIRITNDNKDSANRIIDRLSQRSVSENRTTDRLSQKSVRSCKRNSCLHKDHDTCFQSEILDSEKKQQREVIRDCQVRLLPLSPKVLPHRTRQASPKSWQGQKGRKKPVKSLKTTLRLRSETSERRTTNRGIKTSERRTTHGRIKTSERRTTNGRIKTCKHFTSADSNTLVENNNDVHTGIVRDNSQKKSRASVSKGQIDLVPNTPTSTESVHKDLKTNTEPSTSTIVGSTCIGRPTKNAGCIKNKNRSGSMTEPDQVYYISSSSNDNTSQGGTCIEISDSEYKLELLSEETNNHRSNSSRIDIFDSGSDDSHDENDIDNDFVPTSDLDEIDLDDIYNFHLKVLPSKTVVSIPKIASHARHPDLKLCIIKLYRNKSLDIKEKGNNYAVYS